VLYPEIGVDAEDAAADGDESLATGGETGNELIVSEWPDPAEGGA